MHVQLKNINTHVAALGEAKIASPIKRGEQALCHENFVFDNDRVLIDVDIKALEDFLKKNPQDLPAAFEKAGPRSQIYFDPSKLKCAIVTCGGLCPGLNDIIRAVVLELCYSYSVRTIYGVRYGLQGFIPEYGHEFEELTPDYVSDILERGGTVLGSSRGPQSIDAIVDTLDRMNIGALFMVGGDGTLKAATLITKAIAERNLKISVVGIPKTIDNDIHLVARSFGFDTAVDVATQAVRSAHNESAGYPNGIGLIKLMGRHSGFIATTAALAQQEANFVLIPEVDFDMDGANGLLSKLEQRLKLRGHAVIVVAEGAGQRFFENQKAEKDESGNLKLKDIGVFLKKRITTHFQSKGMPITLKYIDPSYMIRSLPANANDRVFCSFLGRDAVHAAMSGKTEVLIGFWNNHIVHIPMAETAWKRKQVDPLGKLWMSVLDSTGQGTLKNEC